MDYQNYVLFKYSKGKHFIKFYKTILLLKGYIVYLQLKMHKYIQVNFIWILTFKQFEEFDSSPS